MKRNIVVLLSGGMDSTTLAYQCVERIGVAGVIALSVNYGQRHSRELISAKVVADRLGIEHVVADLSPLRALFSGSALTDDAVAVPEGHYAAETMKATVVPMRNPMFLCVAAGLAWARHASEVAIAVHAGDHAIYPDCRPTFVEAFNVMLREASEGFSTAQLSSPFVQLSKADIAATGHRLGVQWADTWSCYKGGDVHCGKCGTCVERREAFQLAGVNDPTPYES